MKLLCVLLISILTIQKCVAPPVAKKEKEESDNHENEIREEMPDDVEYRRYLEEVIYALESDPEFRDKLEKANETEIRNGNIADELEYVNHKVRTKLDELKRTELERLRHLANKEFELENGLDLSHMKIATNEHLDESNPHTFEVDDLKRLIAKTTKDLEEADKKRKQEFKEYEMHKKYEQEEKMKTMTLEEKTKYELEIQEMEKKHKDHEPLHHPGSKKQLEEVWKTQDNMEYQQFDPRTFFYLHDLDGNGVWDQNELKTLFLKELDKLYASGHPEDDLVERAEELERMREHVIKEADVNKDGLISYEEFLDESKKAEFEKDPGWEPLDEQQLYSEQEYEEYKKQKAREIERAISQRMLQENHPAGQPQAGHQQFPSHPNQIQQDYVHQQAQYQHGPGQQQQLYPQQAQFENQLNQMPVQQGQFNQMAINQGQHMNQPSPQQLQFQVNAQIQPPKPPHPGEIPDHPKQMLNQIPSHPGQLPNQMPPQTGQLPNQMQFQQQQTQQFHPNQQVPIPNHINQIPPQQNYPPPNQQVPQPQQQFQHPSVVPNQIHQQQFNAPPSHQQNQQFVNPNSIHQVPQQIQTNQIPQNVQINQVPGGTGQIPNQHPPVMSGQNQVPSGAGHLPNQQNTQNQIPQQTHEQVASLNNAQQAHH